MSDKHFFSVLCHGRDTEGQEVLAHPVDVRVKIRLLEDGKTIAVGVECVHNTGGHGERCKASHPGQDKVGEGIRCPYAARLG